MTALREIEIKEDKEENKLIDGTNDVIIHENQIGSCLIVQSWATRQKDVLGTNHTQLAGTQTANTK